ncbi:MAG TPA: DUF58 domain-containing protein, partial [Gammaproteobacteria bacterium]|nr:DUF58 domain-containing protein [Gammaproteobacteria bacterium]
IGLVALLGIAGEWSAAFAFPWWRLAAGLLVLALAYEAWSTRRRRVAARWLGGARLPLGRPAALTLELTNGSERPLRVQCAPVLPAALRSGGLAAVRLPPAGSGSIAVAARPVLLGEHPWPALPIRIRGPFGLAWWSRALAVGETLIVVPDSSGRRAGVSGSASSGGSQQAVIGSGLELEHLRPYRPGDPRRAIDWKATARSASLVTRVFSEDQHLEIVLALDAGRTSRVEVDGMSQLGHYVNVAARFAEYCIARDDLMGLVVFAAAPLAVLPPARGLPAVTRMRRALAGLEPLAVESDPLEAAMCVRRLVRRRCLVIVLTDLYERGSEDRLAESVRLLTPYHLPVIVGLTSGEVDALAAAEARDWLDPYRSLAAAEHKRRIEAGLRRLARLGALTLAAPAAELDGKLLDRYRMLRARRRV